MEGTLGEIRIFAGIFAPTNWAFCHGQTLKIVEMQALYSILGTTYGGDGQTSFGLPNLVGKSPAEVAIEFDGQSYVAGQYIICVKGFFPSRG
jgi:microcystin-dependent protein